MEEEEGEAGRGVYVMLTFRLDFHIGRVECVTCHVPVRKEGEGAVKVGGWARWEEVVGGRREMGIVGADIFGGWGIGLYGGTI